MWVGLFTNVFISMALKPLSLVAVGTNYSKCYRIWTTWLNELDILDFLIVGGILLCDTVWFVSSIYIKSMRLCSVDEWSLMKIDKQLMVVNNSLKTVSREWLIYDIYFIMCSFNNVDIQVKLFITDHATLYLTKLELHRTPILNAIYMKFVSIPFRCTRIVLYMNPRNSDLLYETFLNIIFYTEALREKIHVTKLHLLFWT